MLGFKHLHNSSQWDSIQPICSNLASNAIWPLSKYQERETLGLFSSHVFRVNVKSKPFNIFPCWKISLSQIGVSQTQYLYYVMRVSYYQNSRVLDLNYLIFEVYTLKWTINSSANMRAFWFQYNFMSIPFPPPSCRHHNCTFGQLSREVQSEIPKTLFLTKFSFCEEM